MAFDVLEQRIKDLSDSSQIPVPTLRAVFGQFVAALHEMEFKKHRRPSLEEVYFNLGPEAAWHYLGIACEILASGESEYTSDSLGEWNELASRLDGRMSFFRHILERWKEEHEYELEQEQADNQQ